MNSIIKGGAAALLIVASGLAGAAQKQPAPPAVPAASAEDVRELRDQLAAFAERLQRVEQVNQVLLQANAQLKDENTKLAAGAARSEQTLSAQNDAIAKQATTAAASDWASRISISGDFRYRDENIQRDVKSDQQRDRIRARIGLQAKATDNLLVGIRLATGADDPRSPNQTIGAAGTGEARRSIGLDQYYVNWKALPGLVVTGGKIPYPYWRPGQSLLNDSDINPEGIAAKYAQGLFFANAFGFWISERGTATNSLTTGAVSAINTNQQGTMYSGAQLGVKVPFNDTTNLTAAIQYSDLGAGKGRAPFWVASGTTVTPAVLSAAANGNTVDANGNLVYGYKVTQLSAEFNAKVVAIPVQVFADYAKNSDAGNGQDKAYTAGFLVGKALERNSWELGYAYEKLEKDAYFAAFVDSDFGAGFTDSKGSVFRLGYAPVKNWTLNVTYLVNRLNLTGGTGTNATGGPVNESYKRLDLDFNVKY